jgi:pyridoxal phosphate enzyme (YggS family)
MNPDTERSRHLQAGLAAVAERVRRACRTSGRSPDEITTIVVTKTYPAADIRLLADLGVRDVGENRVAEGQAKATELADLRAAGLRFHQIGQVQTNKAAAVARWADLVHSLDRPRLVAALDRAVERAERDQLDVLIQVSIDDDPARGGAPRAEVDALADLVAASGRLRLRGVMAVAPLGMDPVRAFSSLAEVAARVRDRHPDADLVSAGMSADLEAAICCGATHLRVGTAVLGTRPTLE